MTDRAIRARRKVENFAAAFALIKLLPEHQSEWGTQTVPPGSPRLLNDLILDGSAKMTNRFVNFLSSRL